MAELGNDLYNPRVDYTRRIKGEILPASTTMLVRVMTMSGLNY